MTEWNRKRKRTHCSGKISLNERIKSFECLVNYYDLHTMRRMSNRLIEEIGSPGTSIGLHCTFHQAINYSGFVTNIVTAFGGVTHGSHSAWLKKITYLTIHAAFVRFICSITFTQNHPNAKLKAD